MERREVCRGELCNRSGLTAAAEWHSIRVILAIDDRRQGPKSEADGLLGFLGDRGKLLIADSVHFGRSEGRVANDVGHEVERLRKIGFQSREIDARAVHARRSGNSDAE